MPKNTLWAAAMLATLVAASANLPALANGAAASNGSTSGAASAEHQAYSTNTPVGTLMDDPAARAILVKLVPIAKQANQNPMGRQMSLRQMQSYAPDQLTNAKLDKVDVALAKLTSKSPQK